MNYDEMTHQAALTEWNGGGLDDIPTENLKEFNRQLTTELLKRGATIDPLKYSISNVSFTVDGKVVASRDGDDS